MNKIQTKKLRILRRAVEKEKKRLRIAEPKFTIQLDTKTNRLLLGYNISVDVGIDDKGERVIKRKQKKKYLANTNIDDLAYVIMNVQNYSDLVMSEINKTNKAIGGDKDTLGYWIERYDNPNRVGTLTISEASIRGDRQNMKMLKEWIKKNEPEFLNIWNWVDGGRDCLIRYMKYKQKYGGLRKVWGDGSVNSNYRRIRAFFNFVSMNLNGFPNRLLNNMPFVKSKIETETFSSTEITIVKQWMEEKENSNEWFWFVPMLHFLLETGCRVSEVCKVKIRDLDIDERRISVIGKGKKRWLYLKSESLWNRLKPYIFTMDGRIRTDKEFVFHYKHSVASYGKWFLREDLTKGFRADGVSHKFKRMIRETKINERLTTHCTRRYFITEMLKQTSGDIPLVAQLVGHNNWDTVKLYTKDLIDDSKKVNVGLFD